MDVCDYIITKVKQETFVLQLYKLHLFGGFVLNQVKKKHLKIIIDLNILRRILILKNLLK